MTLTQENIAKKLFLFSALLSAVIIGCILFFMIALGLPLFTESDFLSIWTGPWSPGQGFFGIWPMILGTLWIAILASFFSLPLSLGTSFVMTELAGPSIQKVLNILVRFMTGIPTVVYGFVGIFLLVPFIRESFGGPGSCVFSASLILAVLISPTMILFFSDSLKSVDKSYVEAAKALGANKAQRLLYVMAPQAFKGMTSGFILALGRAIGDTLIALMLAGNAVQVPQGIFEPARTLTAHIALVKAADFESLEFRSIFACGIALYVFTTLATFAVRTLAKENGTQNV